MLNGSNSSSEAVQHDVIFVFAAQDMFDRYHFGPSTKKLVQIKMLKLKILIFPALLEICPDNKIFDLWKHS